MLPPRSPWLQLVLGSRGCSHSPDVQNTGGHRVPVTAGKSAQTIDNSFLLYLMNCKDALWPGLWFWPEKAKSKIRIYCGKQQSFIRKTDFLSWKFNFPFKIFFFNECFLPSASSSKVVESHGLEYPDGKADTQFHFIPMWGSRYSTYKSEKKKKRTIFPLTQWKKNSSPVFFPFILFQFPCLKVVKDPPG